MKYSIHKKSHSYSIMLGNDKVYSFDLEGRLLWIYQKPLSYQRGLSNTLLRKWRDSNAKYREICSEDEREQLYSNIYRELEQIYKQESSQRAVLELLLKWTPDKLTRQQEHFAQIYQPISILPPDQYSSIVVQAAIGCSYNKCIFCNFYKDRKFYIKTLDEFEQHLADVQLFLGQSQSFRKSIFLADGDALMIPQKRLLEMMNKTQQVFPERKFYSFMDAFRPGVKTLEHYVELKEAGLERVYIGLETGHAELLRFLEKPGTPELMRDEVLKMKNAGLNVGVIIMLGIGGDVYAERHIQDSILILNQMKLGKGDMIYFSEFIEHPDQPYHVKIKEQGINSLTTQQIESQFKQIKSGLIFAQSVPQLSLYHLNEYIY